MCRECELEEQVEIAIARAEQAEALVREYADDHAKLTVMYNAEHQLRRESEAALADARCKTLEEVASWLNGWCGDMDRWTLVNEIRALAAREVGSG